MVYSWDTAIEKPEGLWCEIGGERGSWNSITVLAMLVCKAACIPRIGSNNCGFGAPKIPAQVVSIS